MKIILRVISLIFAIIISASCEKLPSLTLNTPKTINFADQGGTQSITFSANRNWTVSSSESWCTVSPSSGSAADEEITVTLTCETNSSYDSRKAILTFHMEDIMETISITQDSNLGILSSLPSSLIIDGSLHSIDFTVQANIEYSIVVSEDSSHWIQIAEDLDTKALNNCTYRIIIDSNYSLDSRIGKILVLDSAKTSYCETSIEQTGATILSSSETANCYIVNREGWYCFDATKQGNSMDSVGDLYKACLIWETQNSSVAPKANSLITHVVLHNKLLFFEASSQAGNSLIGVKDKNDTILWSWHIWSIPDYDPEGSLCTYSSGYRVMDRNLGAISATVDDTKSIGLMYQWGRKDPFMGSCTWKTFTQAKAQPDILTVEMKSETVGQIEYTISHPTVFISTHGIPDGTDWQYDYSAALWRSSKTKYDPCPPGYHVPFITNAHTSGPWLGFPRDFSKRTAYGGVFSAPYSVPDTWYPRTGFIDDTNEGKGVAIYQCFLWSSNYSWSNIQSSGFCFLGHDNGWIQSTVMNRSAGIPVRCVK